MDALVQGDALNEREALDPSNVPPRLLAAAQAEFLACGFHRTTISAIAKRARMSKATVYGHFDSKEELFLEAALGVMREAEREVLPALELAGPAAARPEDAVDALFLLLPRMVETSPLFFELWSLLARAPALRERCLAALRSFYRRFAAGLRLVVERAAPERFAPGEAEAAALALVAAMDGLCFQWLFIGDRVLLTRTGSAIRAMWLKAVQP